MSYDNDRLEKIIEASQALIEANNSNEVAQANLVEAQATADSAQTDVDELNALLDTIIAGSEGPDASKVRAVLGKK